MSFIHVDPDARTFFRERGSGRPFVMVGLNYFDHETGWPPKLWHKFDEQRVRRQLTMVRDLGLNTIRVFLTQDSFHREPGKVRPEGEAKFRQLLAICRELGLYVMPSGPDHWEGIPPWRKGDIFADETILRADEAWWADFTNRFRGEPVIIAWDLLNEPAVRWTSAPMRRKWSDWLREKYGQLDKVAEAWGCKDTDIGKWEAIESPPPEPAPNDQRLYDYQLFREHIGDEWTRRLTTAIRSADPNHMITVGHVQWAVPLNLPSVKHHAGFNLDDNARHLDFTTVHFYPAASPRPCDGPDGIAQNAAYLKGLLSLASTDKPLVLGEFGWYGGGELRVNGKLQLPAQPQSHQVDWCRTLLDASRGHLAGWLNWAFADTPTSTDLTRWSGCWTQQMELKPWGGVYRDFAHDITLKPEHRRPLAQPLPVFEFDRRAMLTSPEATRQIVRQLFVKQNVSD